MPRVEVLPAPSGEERRHDQDDRRRPAATERPPHRAADDPLADGRSAENGHDPGERGSPRPAPRFPARPSAAREVAPREPEWVERGDDGFTAPTFPPTGPPRLQVPPALVAVFAAAWLVVVALLVALLAS
jgi:hypothetical protein